MGKIKPKERDAILMSLSVGLVPKIGLQHIQVGRD
ncbi:BREX system ATP-binding domain-containing protein, partial [Methanoregula sp.]